MNFDPLTAAFDLGKIAIEKIWPDPTKRAEELRKLEELKQNGDLAQLNAHVQLMASQLEVNQVEAQHKSLFVAGWRPSIGWVGAIALALAYIPKAIVLTTIWTWQCILLLQGSIDPGAAVLPVFPNLGITDVIGLLGSMLGISAMRTYERNKGVETNKLG